MMYDREQMVPNDPDDDHLERQAWLKWRSSTEFLPMSALEDVINRPNVMIPAEYTVSMVCDNLEQFQAFCAKLMDHVPMEHCELILPADYYDDETPKEEHEFYGVEGVLLLSYDELYDVDAVGPWYTFDTNPYWENDGQLQVAQIPPEDIVRRRPETFIPTEAVTFPCLLVYNVFDVSDRVGRGMAYMCNAYPLGPAVVPGRLRA